jgi:hypothetical protein
VNNWREETSVRKFNAQLYSSSVSVQCTICQEEEFVVDFGSFARAGLGRIVSERGSLDGIFCSSRVYIV